MFCKYCGRKITDIGKKCPFCGNEQGSLYATDGYFGILQAAKGETVKNAGTEEKRVVSVSETQKIMEKDSGTEHIQMKLILAAGLSVCILIGLIILGVVQKTYLTVKEEYGALMRIAVLMEDVSGYNVSYDNAWDGYLREAVYGEE